MTARAALPGGPPAGELWLEFHDSEVRHATLHRHCLQLEFSAAACAVAPPGARPGARASGYLAPVLITLDHAECAGSLKEAVGRLTTGRWQAADGWRPTMRVPVEVRGPIALELAFANGTQLTVKASALSCQAGPAPQWVESWQC